MSFKVLMLASALATSTLHPLPASAGFNAPYLRSFGYSGKLPDCVLQGQKALERQGYKVDEVKYSDDRKIAWLYATHPDLALGATIECDPAEGRTAVGVAGMNDSEAFDSFQKLAKEEW